MQLPVRTPSFTYSTLEDIRLRKEQLAADLQHDSKQFSTLWNQLFVPHKDNNKGEWISGLIANSLTAIDTFLLARKLFKNYGHLLHRRKK